MNMVNRIESMPDALSNSSELWLRDYIKYDYNAYIKQNTSEPYQLTYNNAENFLREKLMDDKNIVFYHRDGYVFNICVFYTLFQSKHNN
jgi:hypothetical protein